MFYQKFIHIITKIIVTLVCLIACVEARCEQSEYDVIVVGGGASGVAAAVQASRLGASVLVAEPTSWVGGMLTAAGVSAIDGNYNLRAGFWGEFFGALVKHYGSAAALQTGWVSNVLYEPHVGNEILTSIISQQNNVRLLLNAVPVSIEKVGGKWVCIFNDENGTFEFVSKVLIDATELGDVAKDLGVTFDVGMESRYATGEDIAPETGNGIIQDLTYVAILKDYGAPQTPVEPHTYNPDYYSCCCINDNCTNPSEPDRMWAPEKMLTYGKLPGSTPKYMINWPIEGNDYYLNLLDMTPGERTAALQYAKDFTLGFVYFMQTELGMNTLGLADDEFPTEDLLPFIPYHRESRRIHGKVRFTLPHISEPYSQSQPLYRTAIAVGDYAVDHHHARYTGEEELPNLYFHAVPSFGLPLGTLLPHGDFSNFIVAEKSISVSNIVNGATRLQPVVMQIGTAAGTLAGLAVKHGCDVEEVTVRDVQNAVLEAGGYLLPYLDVDKTSSRFLAYQRIGATGILQAEGKNEGWANQTWLNVANTVYFDEIQGLKDYYALNNLSTEHVAMTLADFKALAEEINLCVGLKNLPQDLAEAIETSHIVNLDTKVLTRGDFAVLIDAIFNPFSREVDITGNLIDK